MIVMLWLALSRTIKRATKKKILKSLKPLRLEIFFKLGSRFTDSFNVEYAGVDGEKESCDGMLWDWTKSYYGDNCRSFKWRSWIGGLTKSYIMCICIFASGWIRYKPLRRNLRNWSRLELVCYMMTVKVFRPDKNWGYWPDGYAAQGCGKCKTLADNCVEFMARGDKKPL